ncbi:cytochrome c3 family protein [Tropicibacter oceani]|uniref:Cytochrome c3 family protein n=1 Tax=Tropicibacter oceani TaxID=3058420 RepID=A0ABY8QPY4_9RHOB|nr:cytochrome c3 family protein [Tropicibacter oceani]WGW05988.1 cytochrome c3 family protein [Tropicibacter oceani]
MPLRLYRIVLSMALALCGLTVFSTAAQAGEPDFCIVEDRGVCIWPAASADDKPHQQQSRSHGGEPGLVGRDGKPVPDHECSACHEEPDLLPQGHLPTAGMSVEGCRICHGTDQAASLDDRLFQSHTHFFAGLGCADCHADPEDADEPEMAVCTSCHGTLPEIAAQTADVVPTNPHDSPHGEPYAQCGLCHYQHEPPDNFCATCHDFDFTMP